MGRRMVAVVGSPVLTLVPALVGWAGNFLREAFNNEGPSTVVLGRNASPVELWAWEEAHAHGLDRVVIGADGVFLSSRKDIWPWPPEKDSSAPTRATEVLVELMAIHR